MENLEVKTFVDLGKEESRLVRCRSGGLACYMYEMQARPCCWEIEMVCVDGSFVTDWRIVRLCVGDELLLVGELVLFFWCTSL